MRGCLGAETLMERFRRKLEKLGLNDLRQKRDIFTWSNKHKDETFTKKRLDWIVANWE